ncbi:MAG: hypothetical protein FWF59_12765 [Turicibacter sp.]|nr:hypothetical protein [Turicibacter sp.]
MVPNEGYDLVDLPEILDEVLEAESYESVEVLEIRDYSELVMAVEQIQESLEVVQMASLAHYVFLAGILPGAFVLFCIYKILRRFTMNYR